MRRLPTVNPADIVLYPGGLGVFDIGGADDGCKILLYNESPYNIQLDFLNGSTDTLHAWEGAWWGIDADTKQIGWMLDPNSLNVASAPVSAVFLTLYLPGEPINGQYPVSLVRQASVGNSGGIKTTGTVNSLVNTGNAVNTTNIIEISPVGDAGATTTLDNMGNFTNGDATHAGTVSLDAGRITTDGAGLLTAGKLSSDSGKVTTNGAGLLTVTKLSSDTALVATDGVGNLTTKSLTTTAAITATTNVGAATFSSTAAATLASAVITGNATANTMQVSGQFTGSSDVKGNTLTAVGAIAGYTLTTSGNATVSGVLTATNASNNIAVSQLKGTTNLPLGKVGVVADGDVLDASTSTTYLKARGGSILFQTPGGLQVGGLDPYGTLTVSKVVFNTGGIKDLNTGTVSANGTVNHGLSGAPAAVLMTPSSGSSTWTFGASSYTTTQFTATMNTSATTRWVAYR